MFFVKKISNNLKDYLRFNEVSRMRLELTRPNGHYPLKVARLPIPPPRQTFVFSWSEKRDSNPRPRPWQGRTPPTEPLAHKIINVIVFCLNDIYSIMLFFICQEKIVKNRIVKKCKNRIEKRD